MGSILAGFCKAGGLKFLGSRGKLPSRPNFFPHLLKLWKVNSTKFDIVVCNFSKTVFK